MLIDKIRKQVNINSNEQNEQLTNNVNEKRDIPIGKWVKCDKCKEILYKETVHENYSICPNCGNHFRLSSRRRLKQIIDDGTYKEFDLNLKTSNPLNMDEYIKKLDILKEKTGIDDAVRCGIRKYKFKKGCYLYNGWKFYDG